MEQKQISKYFKSVKIIFKYLSICSSLSGSTSSLKKLFPPQSPTHHFPRHTHSKHHPQPAPNAPNSQPQSIEAHTSTSNLDTNSRPLHCQVAISKLSISGHRGFTDSKPRRFNNTSSCNPHTWLDVISRPSALSQLEKTDS